MTNKRTVATIATLATGSLTFLSSIYALYLSCQSLVKALRGGFTELILEYRIGNFYYWFYPMLVITVLCSILLVLCGLDQMRIRLELVKLFISVIIFEIMYFIFIGMILWPARNLGLSVGAATGAASNGLWVPYYFLLPIWAPFVVLWAKRVLLKPSSE